MATVYRLQKIKHNPTTLSGEGARLLGGRWNEPGTPLVYTSSTSSLTILELRVHLGKLPLVKSPPLNIVTFKIPDECIHDFALNDLPFGWNTIPVDSRIQQFLKPMLQSNHAQAYSVPSVINPLERNILINPEHPEIGRVKIDRFDLIVMDDRLF